MYVIFNLEKRRLDLFCIRFVFIGNGQTYFNFYIFISKILHYVIYLINWHPLK